MSVEPSRTPHSEFASLESCFVEGSPEQRARERRIRRRALIVSLSAQAAILTTIVLIPLFGKPERIAFAKVLPLPPYSAGPAPQHPNTPTRPTTPHSHVRITDLLTPPNHIPQRVDPSPLGSPDEPGLPSTPGTIPCVAGCIPIGDARPQPVRPVDPVPQTPRRIRVTSLEPAMLLERVEPSYPPLARQIRRSGKVELRAIIATDGTIQSLQVISGDELFIQSAENAVRQWRYRPTILNGQPVEIDTFITVLFTLEQ